MKSFYLLSLAALVGISSVCADSYKEILSIDIIDDNNKNYTVEGNSCDIEMQYFSAVANGEIFNGATKDNDTSSIVYKRFKDGRNEAKARYILFGKDADNNDCSIFIEDNAKSVEGLSVLTKPIIVTNCPNLGWIQTADIQGRVEDQGDSKTVKLMWNESNTSILPYPSIKMPDTSRVYDKELFAFAIGIGPNETIMGADEALGIMIAFTCTSKLGNFVAEGLDTFVDTRTQFKDQYQTLSARYILQGKDEEGRDTRIYVENDGVDHNDVMTTEPFIVSDNPKWAWIEKAPLHGTASWDENWNLTIHLWTVNDPSLWTEPEAPVENEIDSEVEVDAEVDAEVDSADEIDSADEN